MDKHPDSTLEAAKKMAAALHLAWSEVQPIYRELQMPDRDGTAWLPKSAGRKIWLATPNYLTRLLIAIGFKQGGVSSHMANYISHGLTPGGREFWMTERPVAGIPCPVEAYFETLLFSPSRLAEVKQAEFYPATKEIRILSKSGDQDIFEPASGGFWADGDVLFRQRVLDAIHMDTGARVSSVTVIAGDAFVEMASNINWRTNWPVAVAAGGEGDE